MNMPLPISIVIPTCGRSSLLARTLHSLASCERPDNLRRVVVVENGARGDAASIIKTFTGQLPVSTEYVASPNKSRALNRVLERTPDELLLFFDDDVRILPRTLAVYAAAANDRVSGFWGGRCRVDYEEEPVAWLKSYLPPSATGWSLGETACRLTKPNALGFNWAAFSRDLRQVGAFNEDRGPGTFARGQESEMQERLLRAGIEGEYLPNAIVYHYVPKTRCSEEWALERSRQTARACGVNVARKILIKRLRHDVMSAGKILVYNALLNCFHPALSPSRRFHYQYWREFSIGIREGIRRGQPDPMFSRPPQPATSSST